MAAGERTVMSSGVQPSMRMTADWPEISPPSGATSAVRMPLARVTGSNSLSGLMLVMARAFGLICAGFGEIDGRTHGADFGQDPGRCWR